MKTCKDCRYAEFEKTKHNPPRINSNKQGNCFGPFDRHAAKLRLEQDSPIFSVSAFDIFPNAIYTDQQHNCQLHEPKEKL